LGQTEKRSLLPILLIAAGVIVLVAALASIFLFSGGDPENRRASEPEIPFSHIPRVDIATTKSALESGQAVVVDVRDKVYYDDAHIAGAVSVPLGEFESRLGELNQNDWIILYCT
jgi:hypothetical protein